MSEQGIMEARANVVELFEELLTFEQTLIKGLNRAREMRLTEREWWHGYYHDLSQAQPDLYPGIGNSLLCHGMKLLSPGWEGWGDLSSPETVGSLVEAALASDELHDDWSHPEALIWFNVSQFLDRYHFFTLRSSEEDGRRPDEVFADRCKAFGRCKALD